MDTFPDKASMDVCAAGTAAPSSSGQTTSTAEPPIPMISISIPIPNAPQDKRFVYVLEWDIKDKKMPTPINFAQSVAVDFRLDDADVLILASQVERQLDDYGKDPHAQKWIDRQKRYKSSRCVSKVEEYEQKTRAGYSSSSSSRRRRSLSSKSGVSSPRGSQRAREDKNNPDGTVYECSICGKKFSRRHSMRMHEAWHRRWKRGENCRHPHKVSAKSGRGGSSGGRAKSKRKSGGGGVGGKRKVPFGLEKHLMNLSPRKLQKKLKELYDVSMAHCGVCKLGGRMFCCDHCPAVYHPKCLGLSGTPEGDWSCKWCRTSDAKVSEMTAAFAKDSSVPKTCLKIIDTIRTHEYAWIFEDPVGNSVEGYLQIIKEPMCLSDIETSLRQKKYGSDDSHVLQKYKRDMRLVWTNCMTFNQPNTGIWRIGSILGAFFEEIVKPGAEA